MNTNTEIKPWRSRVCGEPAGQLAVAAAADAEISDLRAEIARLQAAMTDKDGNHADDLRAWLDDARDQYEQQAAEIARLQAEVNKQQKQMLRMSTCAGEFARDACKVAKQVQGEPLPEGWSATHMPPWEALTDEAQHEGRISVKREVPPFCDKAGMRNWSAPTLHEALTRACTALGLPLYTTPPAAVTDADKRDAGRYRWLRDYGYGLPQLGSALDESVDAAIAASEQEGK